MSSTFNSGQNGAEERKIKPSLEKAAIDQIKEIIKAAESIVESNGGSNEKLPTESTTHTQQPQELIVKQISHASLQKSGKLHIGSSGSPWHHPGTGTQISVIEGEYPDRLPQTGESLPSNNCYLNAHNTSFMTSLPQPQLPFQNVSLISALANGVSRLSAVPPIPTSRQLFISTSNAPHMPMTMADMSGLGNPQFRSVSPAPQGGHLTNEELQSLLTQDLQNKRMTGALYPDQRHCSISQKNCSEPIPPYQTRVAQQREPRASSQTNYENLYGLQPGRTSYPYLSEMIPPYQAHPAQQRDPRTSTNYEHLYGNHHEPTSYLIENTPQTQAFQREPGASINYEKQPGFQPRPPFYPFEKTPLPQPHDFQQRDPRASINYEKLHGFQSRPPSYPLEKTPPPQQLLAATNQYNLDATSNTKIPTNAYEKYTISELQLELAKRQRVHQSESLSNRQHKETKDQFTESLTKISYTESWHQSPAKIQERIHTRVDGYASPRSNTSVQDFKPVPTMTSDAALPFSTFQPNRITEVPQKPISIITPKTLCTTATQTACGKIRTGLVPKFRKRNSLSRPSIPSYCCPGCRPSCPSKPVVPFGPFKVNDNTCSSSNPDPCNIMSTTSYNFSMEDIEKLDNTRQEIQIDHELQSQQRAMIIQQELQNQRQALLFQREMQNQRHLCVLQQELQNRRQTMILQKQILESRRKIRELESKPRISSKRKSIIKCRHPVCSCNENTPMLNTRPQDFQCILMQGNDNRSIGMQTSANKALAAFTLSHQSALLGNSNSRGTTNCCCTNEAPCCCTNAAPCCCTNAAPCCCTIAAPCCCTNAHVRRRTEDRLPMVVAIAPTARGSRIPVPCKKSQDTDENMTKETTLALPQMQTGSGFLQYQENMLGTGADDNLQNEWALRATKYVQYPQEANQGNSQPE